MILFESQMKAKCLRSGVCSLHFLLKEASLVGSWSVPQHFCIFAKECWHTKTKRGPKLLEEEQFAILFCAFWEEKRNILKSVNPIWLHMQNVQEEKPFLISRK